MLPGEDFRVTAPLWQTVGIVVTVGVMLLIGLGIVKRCERLLLGVVLLMIGCTANPESAISGTSSPPMVTVATPEPVMTPSATRTLLVAVFRGTIFALLADNRLIAVR